MALGFLYGFGLPTAPDMYNLSLKYFVYSIYFQSLQTLFQFAIKQSLSEAD